MNRIFHFRFTFIFDCNRYELKIYRAIKRLCEYIKQILTVLYFFELYTKKIVYSIQYIYRRYINRIMTHINYVR